MQILSLFFENPLMALILMGGIVFAIGLHEAAHAYSSHWLGDPTPKLQGRLTLNPLAHLDPMGTLLIVIAGIGWGKPVEFNPLNLKHGKRDIALIAFAGPAVNIVIAIICALLVQFLPISGYWGMIIPAFLKFFAILNINLAVFNLLPVDPLDGFKVVAGLLPNYLVKDWYETRKYGLIVLAILFITGAIDKILSPISKWALNFLF